jgi:hypothetical protein
MKKMGKGSILLGAVFIAASFVGARSYDVASAQDRPTQLCQECHQLTLRLNTFDRVYTLFTLVKNSKEIVSDAQYREWCLEMFEQSFKINDGWDRVGFEKNALARLSQVDSLEAFRRFSNIEDPQPQHDGTFPEDVRADAAFVIFANVWDSASSSHPELLHDIEAQATRLGKTGEYPFVAMDYIITKLGRLGTEEARHQANAIFSEAIDFYKDEPDKFQVRDEQFYQFLQETKDVIVDPQLRSQAARTFAEKVQHARKVMDYESDVETAKGTTHFSDAYQELLFRAFPLIEQFDKDLAAELTKKDRTLEKAVAPMTVYTGGYAPLNADVQQLAAIHNRIRQFLAVQQITAVQNADLDKALTLAAGLKDDGFHIQGYSALLPALAKADRAKAERIYYAERSRLQELRNEDDRLKATVALAKASQDVNDQTGFSELSRLTFRRGALLFNQDSQVRPEYPYSGRRGYKDLTDMVTFGTALDARLIDDEIGRIDNINLKVSLLSYEAKVLHDSSIQK